MNNASPCDCEPLREQLKKANTKLRAVKDIAREEIRCCKQASKDADSMVIASKMRREIMIHQRYLNAAVHGEG